MSKEEKRTAPDEESLCAGQVSPSSYFESCPGRIAGLPLAEDDQKLMALPVQGKVLGIDVGYAPTRRTTAFCALSWDAHEMDWAFERAEKDAERRVNALRNLLDDRAKVLAVAVDGPLRPGLRLDTQSYRAAESLLSRGEFQKRGKPGPTNAGSGPQLHQEATCLAKLALRQLLVAQAEHVPSIHERAIVEAFPNLFLGVLCDEANYPARPVRKRRWADSLYPLVKPRLVELLRSLLPCRELQSSLDIEDHEGIAGFTCALTALCVAARRFVAVGSPADGFIVLPPSDLWGKRAENSVPWGKVELHRNLETVTGDFPGAAIHEDGRIWEPAVACGVRGGNRCTH